MCLFLLLAFVVVPLIEAWVAWQVAGAIGGGWTLLALIVCSLIGLALVKREGTRAWVRFGDSVRAHQIPAREIADGALVLVGGVLLAVPGFVTDALGFLLVLPITRPFARKLLTLSFARRGAAYTPVRRGARIIWTTARPGGEKRAPAAGRGSVDSTGNVIEGEVVDRPESTEDGDDEQGRRSLGDGSSDG